MIIDGKAIAEKILTQLSETIKTMGVTPTLAVIQIGDNPASLAYIRQKQKAAEKIGAKVIISNILSDVDRFNMDPNIHGLIIQRPVPEPVGEYAVKLEKDVDG